MAYQRVFWFLVGLSVMLLAFPAFATDPPISDRHPHKQGGDGGETPDATQIVNVDVAGSTASSTTSVGDISAEGGAAAASNSLDQTISQSFITIEGDSGAGANATSASSASGEGVSGDILSPRQSVTFTSPDKIKIENVPSMIAPDIYPTVSCFRPIVSGALSWAGFGASGGGGKIDEDCVKREYIRLAHAMGALDRALYMWCQQPTVWEDFGAGPTDCLLFGSEPVTDPGQEHLTHDVADALIEQQAAMLEEAVAAPLRQEMAQVVDKVAGIEDRLDAGAAASRRAAENERMWKDSMAEKYLNE